MILIDQLAYRSKLCSVNGEEKFVFTLLTLLLRSQPFHSPCGNRLCLDRDPHHLCRRDPCLPLFPAAAGSLGLSGLKHCRGGDQYFQDSS